MNPRTERRSAIETECYERLRSELLDALTNDPQRVVATPAFGGPDKLVKSSAADVLRDALNDTETMHLLIGILMDAVRGDDVQLKATMFIDVESRKHAEHHCADMAVEVEEGAMA